MLPLTSLLPAHHACAQFLRTVTWGKTYLQPTSRLLAFLLLATSFATSRLRDPAQARLWTKWALALAVLLPVAPYEVYFIFPINGRVREIWREEEEAERGPDGDGDADGERERSRAEKELKGLFEKWRVRNYGRVVIPVVAGVVGWLGVVR